MKIQSGLGRLACLVTIAALLAGSPVRTLAQGAANDNRPASNYDVEIKGGNLLWTGPKRKDNVMDMEATINNVVDLLRELYPDVNFVVSPALGSYVLSELKLRASSVEATLEAFRVASESFLLWRVVAPTNDAGRILYVLDADHRPATPKSNLQVEAFNLSTYLAGDGTEADRSKRMVEVDEMVRQTVKDYSDILRNVNDPRARVLPAPSIRFHRGANLVIIIGDPEGVAVASKVIGALPGARRSVASDPNSFGDSMQKVDEALKRLEVGPPGGRR